MFGIRIGDYHTYDDFGLILSTKEIGSPAVKVHKIDVEGADGSLDMTRFFGEERFENLTHRFSFSAIGRSQAELIALFSSVKNAIHGKKQRVILDDDPLFFYFGRCFVSSFTNTKNVGEITIEIECDPYKYKLNYTSYTQTVSGNATISLTNGRKRAVPTITASAAFTLGFRGGSYSRAAGTYTIPELELVQGLNVVTVTGTGTITFRWQEGNL